MFSIDADGKSNYLTCFDFEKMVQIICVCFGRQGGWKSFYPESCDEEG